MMHKILLSLAVLSAIAPSGVQANALTRAVTKQNLLAVVKNPGVVMALASAMTLGSFLWFDQKSDDLRSQWHAAYLKNNRGDARIADKLEKLCRQLRNLSCHATLALWGMSASYGLFSAANKFGYINKATQGRKVACMYGIAGSLGLTKLASRVAQNNAHVPGQENKVKVAKIAKLLSFESAAVLATYLLWFA